MRIAAVILALGLLGPALALPLQAAPAARPVDGAPSLLCPDTVSEPIRKWQHEELGKYSQVSFQDVDGKPMAGEAFLRDVSCHRHAFNMTATNKQGEPPTMTLRLLPEAGEATVAQLKKPKP